MTWLVAFGRMLIGNDFIRALILKAIRGGMIAAGPVIAAWLQARGVGGPQTTAIVADLSGLAVSGAGAFFSAYDAFAVKKQDAKSQAVAVQAAIDRAHSVAPLSDAQIHAALQAHALS